MSQGSYSGRCMTCGHDHDNDRAFSVAASFSVEIDEVRQALSQAYFLVTGRSPAFSDTFGTKEALADIDDACRLLRISVASRPAADESAKPVDMSELVRKAKLFDEAVEKKVIPPIFLNGETKRDPVLREKVRSDAARRLCKAHTFTPYYEGVEICSYCKAVRPELAPVASKEAVTLSDEVLDAAIAAYDKAWCVSDRGWANKAGAIEAAFNAIILAQRDASKAEGKS